MRLLAFSSPPLFLYSISTHRLTGLIILRDFISPSAAFPVIGSLVLAIAFTSYVIPRLSSAGPSASGDSFHLLFLPFWPSALLPPDLAGRFPSLWRLFPPYSYPPSPSFSEWLRRSSFCFHPAAFSVGRRFLWVGYIQSWSPFIRWRRRYDCGDILCIYGRCHFSSDYSDPHSNPILQFPLISHTTDSNP